MEVITSDPHMDSFLNGDSSPEPELRQMRSTTDNADDLDDLFDYNVAMDDVLGDIEANLKAPSKKNGSTENAAESDILGIEEEVKVTRKPRIVVKLDENRSVQSHCVVNVILIQF